MSEPMPISDSLVYNCNTHYNGTENNSSNDTGNNLRHKIISRIIDVLLLITGLLIGSFVTFFSNKRTIKMSDIINRSNQIKEIFVNDLVVIKNIDPKDIIEIGDIIVDNINKTKILIQQFLFYVSDSKREEISKHYQEYVNPYIMDSRAYDLLHFIHTQSKKIDEDGDPKPSKYSKTKIPNEKERSLKYLKILIEDFSNV